MDRKTLRLRIAQGLIYLNALIWIVVGAAMVLRNGFASPPFSVWMVLLGVGGIGFGALLAVSGFYLRFGSTRFYNLALSLMILTVMLFIFDDIGLGDLVGLLPAAAALILLVVERKNLRSPKQQPVPLPE